MASSLKAASGPGVTTQAQSKKGKKRSAEGRCPGSPGVSEGKEWAVGAALGRANPLTSGREALCHCPQLELPSRLHCGGVLQGRKQSSPSRQASVWARACRRDLVNERPHHPTEPCPP